MSEVTVDYKGDMLFEAKAGSHTLTIDAPPGMKGRNRGPTPTELYATALASCVNILVTKYCQDMKIPAEGLKVTVTYDKLDTPARLGNFRCEIHMPPAATGWEARRDGIHRAAERCPVHESIRTHTGMEIKIV